MGPLCHQLQQLVKQQERGSLLRCHAVVKVLACNYEGALLRAHCQLEACSDSELVLPGQLFILIRTEPRLEVSIGDAIRIRTPWQSIDVDGLTVLMVRHAELAG